MNGSTVEERRKASLGVAFVAIAFVALALRAWEAVESSLWLDELHTLYHASQPSLADVSDSVRQDNHTPLFFWIVHLFGDWEDGARLRWISVLFSVAGLGVAVALLRGAQVSRTAVLLGAFLYAVTPYQVHYGAELRPYPLLATLSMCAFWCAFARSGPAWARFLGFAVSAGLGLMAHRSMAISIFAIGFARLFVRPKGVLHLGWLILSGALCVLPFLPWLLSFAEHAVEARDTHYERVGGYELREALLNELLQLPARVLEPVMSFLGGPWSTVAYAATVVFGVGFLLALVVWRRTPKDERPRLSYVGRAAALYGVVVFLMTTAFSWYTWDRVPLQYYVGMAWVIPLILAEPLGAACARPLGRFATAASAVAMLTMGIALAGGTSRAHVREGVRLLADWGAELEAAGERPLYTARLAQPGYVFPDALPYRAYAPELAYVEPTEVPQPGDPDFDRPLLVFRRVLPLGRPKWEPIFEGRMIVREERLDWYIWTYELRPER